MKYSLQKGNLQTVNRLDSYLFSPEHHFLRMRLLLILSATEVVMSKVRLALLEDFFEDS